MKPLHNIPFRAGASSWVPTSQLMQSLTPRAAQPVHMSKSKPQHPEKSHCSRKDRFQTPRLCIPTRPSERKNGTMPSSLHLQLPHSSFPDGTGQLGAMSAASQPMTAKSKDGGSALTPPAHPIQSCLNGMGALTFQSPSVNFTAF